MRTGKTMLEKQPGGVFAGVRIMWNSEAGPSRASDWLHGAAMALPWSKRALADELFFLADVALVKDSMERVAP